MNTFTKKLIHFNNKNQREIMPEHLRNTDWRYQVMELSEADLENELSTWPKEKIISWLDWNDPNGIWTDEDAIAEGYEPFTKESAKEYLIKMLSRNRDK